MNRSPGPTPCSALSMQQRGVGVAELALDARLHALGQRVARALHAGQVDEHELRVAAHRDAADRAARRLRLVGDDRDLLADDRVDERRLADVRAARRARRSPTRVLTGGPRPRRDPRHDLALHGEHLAVVGLVVHAGEVQRAVDDRLAQIGRVLGADDDVAELARARRRVLAVDRERQHVGRAGPCRDARR